MRKPLHYFLFRVTPVTVLLVAPPLKHDSQANLRGLPIDVIIAAALYIIALTLLLWLVRAANTNGILTAEEVSVSFVDALAVPLRFQFTHFSTNFGAHVYFWIWTAFCNPSLFYGRFAKVVAVAGCSPLLFLFLRRRLSTNRLGAIIGGSLITIVPGFYMAGFLAIEAGLEASVGMLGLYLATSNRIGARVAAPLLAGAAASIYGAGLAWSAAILVANVTSFYASAHRRLEAMLLLVATALGAVIVVFPLWWWKEGGVILLGGGAQKPADASSLVALLSDLTGGHASYYYFSALPMLGASTVAVLGFIGLWGIVDTFRLRSSPICVLLFAAVTLYLLSAANFPSPRRLVALPIVICMGCGWAVSAVGRVARSQLIASAALSFALILPSGLLFNESRLGLKNWQYSLDFLFVLPEGKSMASQIAWVAEQRSKDIPWTTLGDWEAPRSAALIMLLHGKQEDLEAVYRASSICDRNCIGR